MIEQPEITRETQPVRYPRRIRAHHVGLLAMHGGVGVSDDRIAELEAEVRLLKIHIRGILLTIACGVIGAVLGFVCGEIMK